MPLQTGALPWRLTQSNKPEVLLVTGRRSGRWMIPKGWPMSGKSLAAAAEREAFEEAGISGSVDSRPLGSRQPPVLFYPSANSRICLTIFASGVIGPLDSGAIWVPLSRF